MTDRGGSKSTTRRGFLTLAGLGTVALAGCTSTTPAVLYGLTAVPELEVRRRRGVQVLVARPRALKALDTDHIAVVQEGQLISYFPQAAWSDALPNVVQAKIAEALQNTNALRGVGLPGDGLLIDYQLQSDIRTFALHTAGSDRGVVEIAGRLVNDKNGRTVASQVFKAEVASAGVGPQQAVAALDQAATQVLAEMTTWVLSKV
ncbi:ABC-type transport auxiliary lipoprotein family protein [Roseibium limicola]|uniref:Membrane integrity-associated transporter subunit PqiC n=1 Tax=Roseibium limicola TaxID=2816037 RepID=A0A939EJ67_9HYPH|nr:ABC-type transport auxiliary lipoprotein family protein [Roseibium limicola]MBO0343589.1 membrane integrity-associated transporter subunit PqiC [Roseibium limicola]